MSMSSHSSKNNKSINNWKRRNKKDEAEDQSPLDDQSSIPLIPLPADPMSSNLSTPAQKSSSDGPEVCQKQPVEEAKMPGNDQLHMVPDLRVYPPPSPDELDPNNCYFTISSRGSTYADTDEEDPQIDGIDGTHRRQKHNLLKMSQDADDGPEVVSSGRYQQRARWEDALGGLNGGGPHLYNANRPPMNQEEFDRRFGFQPPSADPSEELCTRSGKFLRHYYRPCLSTKEAVNFIVRLIPILNWLPRYSWRNCLLNDALGGLIVGVMHVPQGIAYANLAGVDAVVGLYTSFFPPLFYMLFGTSRHNSIGSFAVVSLMSGMAVSRFIAEHAPHSIGEGDEPLRNGTVHAGDAFDPVVVSSTLCFCVGLLQLLMGVLRLELIATYFSDQLVAGFTTGASIHVFTAQLKDVFGLSHLPRRSGAGYLFAKLYDIGVNLHLTNPYTFALAIASIVFLCLGKDWLGPWLKRRFRLNVPIPWELLLMAVMTAMAQLFHFRSQLGIRIVGHIPTGLPSPFVPHIQHIPSLLPDALGIAAVVIAVHISLAKMFAKRMAYRVDPAQELFALGLSSSLSSFFPVYPVSCSLGRTLVNVEAGTKTQLSALFSSVLLAAIILYLGQLLRTLPMCILSAIIIVALKGLIKKVTDLRTLWPLSKIDFSIWLVSFLATVCWDVTQGLAVSICFALITTVFRTQWPRWHFLANLSGTNDFRDSQRYKLVCTYPGICIFRFDSPLLFTNVDNFKETIHKAFRRWNRYQQKGGMPSKPNARKFESKKDQEEENGHKKQKVPMPPMELLSPIAAMNGSRGGEEQGEPGKGEEKPVILWMNNSENSENEENSLSSGERSESGKCQVRPSELAADGAKSPQLFMTANAKAPMPIYYRHFIIDCSGFTFVDCMGVNALKEIFTEMRQQQRVLVYFAAAKAPVRDLFEKCGFYQYVQKHNFYPTIRDAVAIARKRRNASTQHLLDEPTERNYDVIDVVQSTQPLE